MSKQPLYPHIPGGRKPEMIGTVWTAKATLYNNDKEIIAYCIDTPNGIAKAFMELPRAMWVSEMYSKELQPRAKYESRMQDWNKADSNLDIINQESLKREARNVGNAIAHQEMHKPQLNEEEWLKRGWGLYGYYYDPVTANNKKLELERKGEVIMIDDALHGYWIVYKKMP